MSKRQDLPYYGDNSSGGCLTYVALAIILVVIGFGVYYLYTETNYIVDREPKIDEVSHYNEFNIFYTELVTEYNDSYENSILPIRDVLINNSSVNLKADKETVSNMKPIITALINKLDSYSYNGESLYVKEYESILKEIRISLNTLNESLVFAEKGLESIGNESFEKVSGYETRMTKELELSQKSKSNYVKTYNKLLKKMESID